jgi:hypothetical protein
MADDYEDDWAPLTPEQLARSSSEIEDATRTPPEDCAEVASKCTPLPERAPETHLTSRQADMLRELQERVAKAGPGNSLISHMQHREMRAKRQQQAARKAEKQLAATCVAGDLSPEPESVIEMSRERDADPREFDGWFQQLPEVEQARLRQIWFDERHKFDDSGQIYRTRLKRAISYGAVAFFSMSVILMGLAGDFTMMLSMTFAGAVAGATAHVLGGGRFVYSGCGLAAYVCVMGTMTQGNPFLLYGSLLAAFVMGVIGMDGEMRRSAGYCKD